MKISQRYSFSLFGLIMAGLTCPIAAAITSVRLIHDGNFISHWLKSWVITLAIMIPFVLLATPLIRKVVDVLTREQN